MKKIIFAALILLASHTIKAQVTTTKDTGLHSGKVTIFKDSRLDLLDKKVAEFNEALASAPRTGRGYRLMVLSTSDRTLAMNLRTRLLQLFPEQKVYMSFQPPYIKLKFGNFLERSEADSYKQDIISAKLVASNIYLVPENIELKPEKNKDKEKEVQ